MEYTHLTRIGNEGDLVKHAVLARIVDNLLTENPTDDFVYVETHAGRAEYRLPDKGRWKNGIGKFSQEFYAQVSKPKHKKQPYDPLMPYIRSCFDRPAQPKDIYPGSSGIVFRMLRQAQRNFRFYLWDLDPAVCHSLLGFYENWSEVSICRGDGFEGSGTINKFSLVLIDPISIEDDDQKRIMKLIKLLLKKDIPFMCWTALVTDQEHLYRKFKRTAEKIGFAECIKWEPKERTSTIGCQITVPEKFGSMAAETISQIKKIMNWR